VVEHLADVWHFDRWKRDSDAHVTTGLVGTTKTRLVEPQTFMNLSGAALRPYTRQPFWAPASDLLVIVDDFALPLGTIRVRALGSAGGHNGLKSIEAALGSQTYGRIRIGVKPLDDRFEADDLTDYLLSPMSNAARTMVLDLMPRLTSAIETWLEHGIERTMNEFNRSPAPDPDSP
jgi:peptidyl-tRNA hydrolase, PTH1 family